MPAISDISIPFLKPRKVRPNRWRERISDFLDSKWALPWCAFIGFLENSVILFAMEPLFLPAMASRGRGAWKVAAALLIGNVLAGVMMYFLGMWADEALLQPAFAMFDATTSYHNLTTELQADGFWPLFMVGITPIPFQLGAAAAGAASYSFIFFLVAVTLSRAIRYFTEAGIVMALGERGERFIARHELEIFLLGIGVFAGMALVYFLM